MIFARLAIRFCLIWSSPKANIANRDDCPQRECVRETRLMMTLEDGAIIDAFLTSGKN